MAPTCRTGQQQIWQLWLSILYEERPRFSAWESDDEDQRGQHERNSTCCCDCKLYRRPYPQHGNTSSCSRTLIVWKQSLEPRSMDLEAWKIVPGGYIGSVGMYQLAALIEAVPRIHSADAPSRCIKDLPSDLPKESNTKMHINAAIKMSRRDNFMGRGMGHPDAYAYVHRLLHRLGYRIGNHRQLPCGAIQWVTDMPICGWGHCRCS